MNDKNPRTLVFGSPVYNEEGGITQFLTQVDALAGRLKQTFPHLRTTILMADDGSSDRSVELVKTFEPKHLSSVTMHSFSKNFGPYPAITALFDTVEGDAMIIMDADLQDSVEVVPEMVRQWDEGFESVRIIRGKRAEGLLHQIASRLFYRFFGKVSGLQSGLGTFGLYDRKVIEAVKRFPEKLRYIPGIISLVGYRTHFIKADREARSHGESRVGFTKLVRFAVLALFSFSDIPIHFITILGIITSCFSALAVVAIIAIRLFVPNVPVTGWASLLCAQFFLAGLIIFSLGVIGQYLAIIFGEVKNRPNFLIRETYSKDFDKIS